MKKIQITSRGLTHTV